MFYTIELITHDQKKYTTEGHWPSEKAVKIAAARMIGDNTNKVQIINALDLPVWYRRPPSKTWRQVRR